MTENNPGAVGGDNVDDLLDRQHSLGEEIQRSLINYGKLPLQDRSNILAVNKHLGKIVTLYKEFCENNRLLQDVEVKDSSYFEDTYYENIVKIYEQGIKKPLADKNRLEGETPINPSLFPSSKSSTSSNIEAQTGGTARTTEPISNEGRDNRELLKAVKIQRSHFFMLTNKMAKAVELQGMQVSPERVQLVINGISAQWESAVENNTKILSLMENLEDRLPYEYSVHTYSDMEDRVEICITTLLGLKASIEGSSNSQANNSTSHNNENSSNSLNGMIHLPKVEIPKFDGNPLKWNGFKNLFVQMIDSANINDAQKLFYLKSNLSGTAASLVTMFDTNLDTYQEAWERITSKYDNPRMLTNAIADKLYSQPNMKEESSEGLRNLKDITKECFASLKHMSIDVKNCESLFVFLLLKKMDQKSREHFEYSLEKPKENPTLEMFYNFLEKRSQALEGLVKPSRPSQSKIVHSTSTKTKYDASAANQKGGEICVCCKESHHNLWDCRKFLNFNIRNKWICLKRNKLCCRCLTKGHYANQCDKESCSCGSNHHRLLHSEKKDVNGDCKDTGKVVLSLQKQLYSNSVDLNENGFVFLGTVLINVCDKKGRYIKCRAILDSCSQVNLLSYKLSKQLGLRRIQNFTNILGVGEGEPVVCREEMVFGISSLDDSFKRTISALILPNLTSYQPSEDIDFSKCNLKGIVLADPNFSNPDSIDVLLGAGIFPSLLSNDNLRLGPGLPHLVRTVFGWIVMGVFSKGKVDGSVQCSISSLEENLEFNSNAPRLWELEEPDDKITSVEEEMALREFERSTVRDTDGRFVVRLPKNKEVSCIGDSYQIALRRFECLERRFAKDPTLFDQYYAFMNEYYQLGHMEKISLNDIEPSSTKYFIPHHAVMKNDSTTTKLRVVFDASSRSSSDMSLNNILLKGPVVQSDLFDLLIRFRFPKFAMSADIEKMYRQILVNDNDRNLQLILWRNNPSLPISIFRLKTVTYGTTPAPFLATKCLHKLGEVNATCYPASSKILQRDFYVDDLITGADDIEQALQIQSELISILASAGFHLRKWCSNDPRLLQNVPDTDKEIQWSPKSSVESVKTLGVIWSPKNDCFSLKVLDFSSKDTRITKRKISSESGSIFDPLGFVNPFVVKAKLIIQELWKQKLDWDDEVPESISKDWVKFREQLGKLNEFSIPRAILCSKYQRIEMHGFADASAKAYGAVIYIRSISENGEIQTSFLCSKSKVAPIGRVTIPKLELSAARLLCDLALKIEECTEYTIHEKYYWSDSEVALWWIQKNPASFKPFVANRVNAIQQLSSISQWNHIPGSENPADIVSRGMSVQDLIESDLWFKGPSFLQQCNQDWPYGKFTSLVDESEACKELRKVTVMLSRLDFNKQNFLESVNHRNSFFTLQKVIGFMLRFIKNCQARCKNTEVARKDYQKIRALHSCELRDYVLKNSVPLTVVELESSLKGIVRFLQGQFHMEKDLNTSLRKLLPFKDREDIIRVGGRLKNSYLPFDAKHPMLLPNCKITDLLIEKIHKEKLHAAPQALLSFVRERFWPLNGKRTCTKIFHRCIICFKSKPSDIHQLMGDLPHERTSLVAPFTHTGIDYAGPFEIHYKLRGKRPTKAYLAVFICFAIKAVHLEVVSDLTTEAFLACLKRFVSRRGRPEVIYSDNATNFIGAKRELKEVFELVEKNYERIVDFCTKESVSWATIPAGSPHFGGLWEAAVKRAKYYMQSLIKNVSLTFEELNTVVIEVESIMNSRPLCPLSENPNDFGALTPNHFLISGCSEFIPDKHFFDDKKKLLKRWELISKLRSDVWEDFHKFYLHNLQERTKWNKPTQNVENGQLVMIHNKGVLAKKWELGRILKAIPGEDGFVRVVDIQTSNGIKRRAITKVAPLPLASTYDEPRPTHSIEDHKNGSKIKFKNSFNNNILISICCFLLILPLVLGNNMVNVTTFNHHPGIFFDGVGEINIVKDRWHLVTYFNLSNYWSQCSDFSTLISRTKDLCSDQICTNTIVELQSKFLKIQQLNVLIKEECHMREVNRRHNIRRRSYDAPLNVIGNIAHSLFGTLDNKYAENMEATLGNIKSNEDRLLLLIKNHTTIIDQTVKVMTKNNAAISEQINKLHSETITLAVTQKKDSKRILFNSLVNYININMEEYREIQLQLHSVMTDFKKGRLNPLLISPDEFEGHVHEMELVIGANYKLPSSHYAELETVAQLAVVHGNSCLMFQIEIPLLRQENFNLYRMVPIPTFNKDKFQFIRPADDYLAIDKRNQFYYLLSSAEFSECTPFYDIKLCFQNQALYPANDENHCEINIFLGSNELTHHCDVRVGLHHHYWIALQQNNHWLYTVQDTLTVKVTCEQDSTLVEKVVLKGEGIIEIHPSCTLDTTSVRIPGKNIIHSTLFLKSIPYVLPQMNLSESTVVKNSSTPLVLKLEKLDAISNAIENAKKEEAIPLKPTIFKDGPDVYHSISFGISGILLIVGILTLTYFVCCKKRNQQHFHQPAIIVNKETERPKRNGSRFSLSQEAFEL